VNAPPSVVTVGAFDGVHLGHRAVLEANAALARRLGLASVLVTFEPHPLEVVRPAAAPPRLTPGDEQLEALATTPLDRVVVLRFDAALAALAPERFVDEVLRARWGMRALVVGHDHALGAGRAGDVATLRRLGLARGFAVEVVPPVEVGGVRCGSSRVREAVAAADFEAARGLLGRPYAVNGTVGRGDGRGRELGVPTINLAGIHPRKLLPPDGVYAVRVEWAGGTAGGMMNQGPRPTFGGTARILEAHLFGVEADLYGQRVRVTWVRRLRDVARFASAEALVAQLAVDRAQALAALGAQERKDT